MPLTKQDLSDILDIVLEALDVVVNPRFDRLESKIERSLIVQAEHSAQLAELNRRLRPSKPTFMT
jgi:hypothetical protein